MCDNAFFFFKSEVLNQEKKKKKSRILVPGSPFFGFLSRRQHEVREKKSHFLVGEGCGPGVREPRRGM